MLVSLLSLGMGGWALGVRLFSNAAVPSWASIVIPMFMISGVQLLSLGVIGEYLAKVFIETKRRRLYFVDQLVAPADVPTGSTAEPAPAPIAERMR